MLSVPATAAKLAAPRPPAPITAMFNLLMTPPAGRIAGAANVEAAIAAVDFRNRRRVTRLVSEKALRERFMVTVLHEVTGMTRAGSGGWRGDNIWGGLSVRAMDDENLSKTI